MLYPAQVGAHGPVVAGPAQVRTFLKLGIYHLGHRVVKMSWHMILCVQDGHCCCSWLATAPRTPRTLGLLLQLNLVTAVAPLPEDRL